LAKKIEEIGMTYAEFEKKNQKMHKVLTGVMPFDYVTAGGIPCGRITELAGVPMAGKSTISFYVMNSFIRDFPEKKVLYIDLEHALDKTWAIKNNFDVYDEHFRIIDPDSGEETLRLAEMAIKTGEFSLVVLDSLVSMAFDDEQTYKVGNDGTTTTEKIGVLPKKLTGWLKRNVPVIAASNASLFILNQARANISPYGGATTIPGGFAKDHYSSIRMEVRPKQIAEGSGDNLEILGVNSIYKCTKNKVGPFGRRGELTIYTATGLSVRDSNIEFLCNNGFIKRSGPYYEYNGEKHLGMNGLKSAFEDIDWINTWYKNTHLMAFLNGGYSNLEVDNGESEQKEELQEFAE